MKKEYVDKLTAIKNRLEDLWEYKPIKFVCLTAIILAAMIVVITILGLAYLAVFYSFVYVGMDREVIPVVITLLVISMCIALMIVYDGD